MTNRSGSAANSHLSTASSVSRVSDGTGFYSPTVSEFGRAPPSAAAKAAVEELLKRHYKVLKSYLAPYLKDEAGNMRPTKARDKLLRLSATQFHELSTDVFDELLRREEDRKRPGGGVPPSLPAKTTFHPKRNQARQKLSTLPPDRFRQLATDVFYELERRIPRFATGDIDRPGSPTGSIASRGPSRQGGPPPGGMRGPPPNGYRGPPSAGMRSNGPPGPYSPTGEMVPPPRVDSRNRSGSVAQGGAPDMSRPKPQTFQSNTIVPNKSTMVEDDETDEEDDNASNLEKSISNNKRSTTGSSNANAQHQERLKEYESQVLELQERIQDLEERLGATEAEVQETKSREDDLVKEKKVWTEVKAELDTRIHASQQSLENLHAELEQSHHDRTQSESGLRAHTEQAVSDLQNELDEMRREMDLLRHQKQQQLQQIEQLQQAPPQQHSRALSTTTSNQEHFQQLQEELREQQALTEEVRTQALQFLQEMRLLSEQSEVALEREEHLRTQISNLEHENETWKGRYANAKTQIRSLRASSLGLGVRHESDHILRERHHLTSDDEDGADQPLLRQDGLVRDVDVTTYQMSIDELVHAGRDSDPELALQKAKFVIKAVRAIVKDIDGDHADIHSPNPSSSPISHLAPTTVNGSASGGSAGMNHPTALKAKISRDANRLVTAARTHATSHGLAPVSLLDAAASNLTASVVSLLKLVGIKPSPASELKHTSADFSPQEIHSNGHSYGENSSNHTMHGAGEPLGQGRYMDEDEIQPLHLQPRTFDAGMESPIIKDGYGGMGGLRIRKEPQEANQMGYQDQQRRESDESEAKAEGKGLGVNNGGGTTLGSGWFNMLKSPTLGHKSSMVESEGESDDERYDYA